MKSKRVGCLAATALGAAIVATPAMAFRGGGGFGGMHGGGMHFGGMPGGGMRFGGGGFRGGMVTGRSGVVPGGNRFVGAPSAGPHVVGAPSAGPHVVVNRFNNFAFRDPHRFRNFAFVGAPFFYDYSGYGSGCWQPTSYGWQWSNICDDYATE